MRILCAVGVRGGSELVRRAAERIHPDGEWLLLHVIDAGPRHALERFGPPHRPPPPPPPPGPPHPPGDPGHPLPPPLQAGPGPRESELDRAEESGGEETLQEALTAAQALGLHAATRLERGDPNQVIVAVAQEWSAGLIAIGARERGGAPRQGPASVGHTARFVLDHAPCDVLLLRR